MTYSHLQLTRLHEQQIFQLTGCRYAVFQTLLRRLAAVSRHRRGRPFKYGDYICLVVALMKIKHDLPYRAIEALTGLDHVTLSRIAARIGAALGVLAVPKATAAYWVVDGTHMPIWSRYQPDYTGYKKTKTIKAQVICDDAGLVVAADGGFSGSWHDKKIWDLLVGGLCHPGVILADKGYIGGKGDGDFLVRPRRRNEKGAPDHPGLARKRVIIEHVFCRMKRFRILRCWRIHRRNHTNIVRLIAEICNIEAELRAK